MTSKETIEIRIDDKLATQSIPAAAKDMEREVVIANAEKKENEWLLTIS